MEPVRRSIQAANDRDIDWALTFFAADAVWDMSPWGMGTFEGIEASAGVWANGLLTRLTSHRDIDEARIAAELLAEERG